MRLVITAVLFFFTLAACGDGSDSGGSNAVGGPGVPKCSTVWVGGKTLPKEYEGCTNAGTMEVGVSIPCPDGVDLFTYEPNDNGFFTDENGTIIEAGEDYANTPKYGERFDACR